jgi:hypothetical protein
MASKEQPRWRLLRRAIEERKYLLDIRDVLGYGVGYREKEGRRTREPALVVYVRPGRKAREPQDFPRHQRIPKRVRLKMRGKTVWLPVDIVETEPGRLQQGGDLRRAVSIGHSAQLARTGSVGWIARTDQQPVVCTAFHVLLSMADPRLDGQIDKSYRFDLGQLDNVVQPSREDGGDSVEDIVGFVIKGRRNNVVDVGVVQVTNQTWLAATAGRITVALSGPLGPPRSLAQEIDAVEQNLAVRMIGRTSGSAHGTLLEFPAVHTFEYEDRDVVLFSLLATDIQTSGGDSGALLVDADRRPLGTLVGAAGGRSYFINIQSIIELMNLAPAESN